MRRVTRKAWFGPKKTVGWGWRPQSWEGWVSTAVFVVVLTAALEVLKGGAKLIGLIVVLAMFTAVLLVTGDPPGGSR